MWTSAERGMRGEGGEQVVEVGEENKHYFLISRKCYRQRVCKGGEAEEVIGMWERAQGVKALSLSLKRERENKLKG